VRFDWVCEAISTRAEFHGELSPKVKNGTSIGAAPSKLEFDAKPGGKLEATPPLSPAVEAEYLWFKGKLKIMGYEGQDLITVKNP